MTQLSLESFWPSWQAWFQLTFFLSEGREGTVDSARSWGSWDQGSDPERGLKDSDSPDPDRRLRSDQSQRSGARSLDQGHPHPQPGYFEGKQGMGRCKAGSRTENTRKLLNKTAVNFITPISSHENFITQSFMRKKFIITYEKRRREWDSNSGFFL